MAVYQSKSGTWFYKFIINGRQYHRSVKEATCERDVLKAEAIVKAEILRGKFDLVEKKGEMAFEKMAEAFMEYSKSNKLSWKSDISRVNHLCKFFKGKKLNEICPFLVEQYKSERQKHKTRRKELVSNTTINRELEVLRKMFNIAVKNGWAVKNPASTTDVKKLRQENRVERFLQPYEEEILLSKCTSKYAHIKPIIICALHTGMRRAEILNLKWENINLRTRYITLYKTKNGKERKIPVSQTLLNIFKELNNNKSDYVFVNPKTGQNYTDIKHSFKGVCKKAEVFKLRFHDLRHTAATRMVSSGIDLATVQDILGHADLKTTQRYAHPVPERKLKAIEALDSYITRFNNVVSIAN